MRTRWPKVYLAASYNRKEEINGYASQLRRMNITVTSTWLNEPHSSTTLASEVPPAQLVEYAKNDFRDIDAADVLISFTEPPAQFYPATSWNPPYYMSDTNPRGGRHVEFGYAFAKGKELWVVGYVENLFHYLPQVRFFPTWEAVVAEANSKVVYIVSDSSK